MKKIAILAAASAFVATPALAQEDMGGVKVGVMAGYDNVKMKLDGVSDSKSGIAYGVTAGYDYDLGSAILGIEAEFADATTKQKDRDVFVTGDKLRLSASRELYVGARAGAKVSSNVLLYAKAGYVNSKIKLRYDDGTNWSYRDSNKLDGFRIGAGAELVKANRITRLEYRYSDYGSYGRDALDDLGFDGGLKASRHQVMATVGARF